MSDKRIVPQVAFGSLEDFSRSLDSFHLYFIEDSIAGHAYRAAPHFTRFQESYPELERKITALTTGACKAIPKRALPYEHLWEAYKLMSELVFADDLPATMGKKPIDSILL